MNYQYLDDERARTIRNRPDTDSRIRRASKDNVLVAAIKQQESPPLCSMVPGLDGTERL